MNGTGISLGEKFKLISRNLDHRCIMLCDPLNPLLLLRFTSVVFSIRIMIL